MGMSGIFNYVLDFFKDPTVQEVAGGIAATTLALCFKRVRAGIGTAITKGRKATAWLISPDDSSLGKVHTMTTQDINNMLFMQRELSVLQTLSESSRAAMWQFHNGASFMLANPMFKVKSSLESCRNGVMLNAKVVNSVLVSNLLELVTPVMGATQHIQGCDPVKMPKDSIHQDKIYRFDIDAMESCFFKAMMTTLGVETMYALLVKSPKGGALGILTVQYMEGDNPDAMLSKDLIDRMYDTREKLQLALTL